MVASECWPRLDLPVYRRQMISTLGADEATLMIKRRTWVQDAVRVYKVFVDEQIIGSIGPFQTKSFQISPGAHTVRLAMPTTGRASSASVELQLQAGDVATIRTVRRGGLMCFLKLPLAMGAGARALAADRSIESRFYEGPWIHVVLETARP